MRKHFWLVGLVGVVALTGCSATTTTATPTPMTSVTVQVQGEGTATNVTVVVGDKTLTQSNVRLPYTRQIKAPKNQAVSVSAQNGTATGDIEASVTKQGQTQTDSATGEFATVQAGATSQKKASKTHEGAKMGSQISESPSPLPSEKAVVK